MAVVSRKADMRIVGINRPNAARNGRSKPGSNVNKI